MKEKGGMGGTNGGGFKGIGVLAQKVEGKGAKKGKKGERWTVPDEGKKISQKGIQRVR